MVKSNLIFLAYTSNPNGLELDVLEFPQVTPTLNKPGYWTWL